MKIVESIRRLEMSKWIRSVFIITLVLGSFLFPYNVIACWDTSGDGGGSVPEPHTLLLLATGGGALYFIRRRRNKKGK